MLQFPPPSGVPKAESLTEPQKHQPVSVFVDMATSFVLIGLIREIDRPHRGAIHQQFEDIGSGVMPARIELPA